MQLIRKEIEEAIDTLFGTDIFMISYDRIKQINPNRIKEQYRKKAKLTHPDRAYLLGVDEKELNIEFKKLNDAYRFLISCLNEDMKPDIQNNPFREQNRDKKENSKQDYWNYYYNGVIPKRKLRFLEFLYYKRIINWKTLIGALVWQYKERPRFGEIAVELNYIANEDILSIIKNMKFREKFGDAALRLKYINNLQHNLILMRQKRYNLPIGQFFVKKHIFNEALLNKYLEFHKEHNIQYQNM